MVVLAPMLWGCPLEDCGGVPRRLWTWSPFFIVMTDQNGKEEVGDFDMQEMFDQALRSYEEGKLTQALSLFQLLAEEAVEPGNKAIGWTHVALCQLGLRNMGSALEALGQG